jgi:NAD(P)-dependent dehydrogenase (short-subunit alcohol dehydrogenase family)
MAINHFAPFLLTQALLETVKASPQGRIITVSSIQTG